MNVIRRYFLVISVLAVATALNAQELFKPVQKDVQPDRELVAIFGGEPSLQQRQVTLNKSYFATQVKTRRRELVINLFPDIVVRSKGEVVRDEGKGEYTWRGTVEDAAFQGQAILAVAGNQIAGTVQKDGRMFLIRPISDTVHVVSEVNTAAFANESDPDKRDSNTASKAVARVPAPHGGGSSAYTIDVMLVYPEGTPAACGRFSSIVSRAYENNLNAVWDNLGAMEVRANVTIYCASYTPVGGDLIADLAWIFADPTVAAKRDSRKADLVALMVPTSTYCGRGKTNTPLPTASDEDRGFSVVKSSCGLSDFSLAHEIGHNMGMSHDRYAIVDTDETPDCGYGYTYTSNGTPFGRDVMTYGNYCNDLGISCPRTASFSRQLSSTMFGVTKVWGKPCTHADAASNEDTFKLAAPIVSRWR